MFIIVYGGKEKISYGEKALSNNHLVFKSTYIIKEKTKSRILSWLT